MCIIMGSIKKYLIVYIFTLVAVSFGMNIKENGVDKTNYYKEKWRPQYHFSPPSSWTNDPNGLVYYDGEYHLFFQYHPNSTVWGPMHWGHAVSTDLINWQNLPIAIYPDESGTIFSGSAAVDHSNVTGFQKSDDTKALIAIFTRHKEGLPHPESQDLAYSNDKGRTWTMYKENPILSQPIHDYRDPSIVKYGDHHILSIAAGDKVMFYKSSNFINWTLLSSFGANPPQGSHASVWECPALMSFNVNGKNLWVLLISINPGGPNHGSATQYFVGNFNGTHFVNKNSAQLVRWMDWGPDNYAAALWNDTPDPKPVLISWLNNWVYAQLNTTYPWRGQMTLPRYVDLIQTGEDDYHIKTFPVDAVSQLRSGIIYQSPTNPENLIEIPVTIDTFHLEATIHFIQNTHGSVFIEMSNKDNGEKVTMSLRNSLIEIDRSESGYTNFSSNFTQLIKGSRVATSQELTVDLFFDVSTAELFYDKGLTAFTFIVFPTEKYNHLTIKCTDCLVKSATLYQMKSIWTSQSSKPSSQSK